MTILLASPAAIGGFKATGFLDLGTSVEWRGLQGEIWDFCNPGKSPGLSARAYLLYAHGMVALEG